MKTVTFDEAVELIIPKLVATQYGMGMEDGVADMLREFAKLLKPHISDAEAQRLIEDNDAVKALIGQEAFDAIYSRPLEMKCPACGAPPEEWRYIEADEVWRTGIKVDGERMTIEALSEFAPSGTVETDERYFECTHEHANGGDCLHKWPAPQRLQRNTEFV